MYKKACFKIWIICFIVIGVIILFIYNNYFRIDIGQYKYNMMTKSVESPGGKYMIELYTLGEIDESRGKTNDIYYVWGRLWEKPVYRNDGSKEWTSKNSRTIYWQKNCTEENAAWIDNETLVINGITININKDIYDYRRK